MGAMLGLEETRERLRRDPRQHSIQSFEQADLAIELRENCGGLQADIAAADDRDPSYLGQVGDHGIDVGPGPDFMHALEIASLAAERARGAARRPDQAAISEALPVRELDLMRVRHHRDDAAAEAKAICPLFPEGVGPDSEPLERLSPARYSFESGGRS
jgi:hypothetical protein